MGDATNIPRGRTDLAGFAGKIDTARNAAVDIGFDIDHAASILEVFADSASNTADGEEADAAWLKVEYLARQIQRHARELQKELEKIEVAVMALRRAAAPAPVTDGGAL